MVCWLSYLVLRRCSCGLSTAASRWSCLRQSSAPHRSSPIRRGECKAPPCVSTGLVASGKNIGGRRPQATACRCPPPDKTRGDAQEIPELVLQRSPCPEISILAVTC